MSAAAAQSLELHFSSPGIFYFLFFWASEEGSRCEITGLRDSYSFDLELRVLLAFCCEMKWGATSGRRRAASCRTPPGYLTPSTSAFVFPAPLVPADSSLRLFSKKKPSCFITSTCFTRHAVALATEGHFETLKERQCCVGFFFSWKTSLLGDL